MRRAIVAALAAVVLMAAGDAGPPIPRYDVEGNCRRLVVARDVPASRAQANINLCVQEDQAAYDWLRLIWPTAHADDRRWAIDRNASDGNLGKAFVYEGLLGRLQLAMRRREMNDIRNGHRTFQPW